MLHKNSFPSEHLKKRADASKVVPEHLGITVTRGIHKASWKVPSSRSGKPPHLVEMTLDFDHFKTDYVEDHPLSFKFICSCEAGQFHNPCIHALIVRAVVNKNWLRWFAIFAPDLEQFLPQDPKTPAKAAQSPFLQKLMENKKS